MAKKEELVRFHRESIANAADNLFQEKGLEKTTMDDIARAADYSKATLYVYFKSKEEVYYYIVLRAMTLLRDCIESAINSEAGAIKQYKAVCRALYNYSKENPFYYKSLLETIAADPESRKQVPVLEDIYQTGEEINILIQKLVEDGIQQGVFRKDIPALPVGFLYWATISSAIQLAINKQDYVYMRMGLEIDAFLDLAFDTMLRALLVEGIVLHEKEN